MKRVELNCKSMFYLLPSRIKKRVVQMNEIWGVIFRTTLGFTLILVLTRVMGKKQLGQMNIFTYITGIVVGSMVGEIIIHKDVRISEGIASLVLWCFLAIIVEYIGLISTTARVILDGEPSIIIKKGKIIEKQLKKGRLNMDDLSMLLRTNKIFSILDVDYAILEPNGDLSVLKKADKEFITKQDMNIPPPISYYIPSEIIVDGKIVFRNLAELGKDQKWISGELHKQGINNIKDILYAELQIDGSLYIQKRI